MAQADSWQQEAAAGSGDSPVDLCPAAAAVGIDLGRPCDVSIGVLDALPEVTFREACGLVGLTF